MGRWIYLYKVMISLLNVIKRAISFLLMAIFPLSVIHAADTFEQPPAQHAQHGDARSQMIQGLRAAMGDGGPADDMAAEKWFSFAASKNYAPAQVALASMKAFDSDVQDIPQAMELLRKAAKQNNLQAQTELVRLIDSGIGQALTPDEMEIWQKESEILSDERKMAKIWCLAATGAEKWQIPENTSFDTIKKQARNIDTPEHKGISLNISQIGHAVEDGDNAAKTVGAMLLATGNGIKRDTKLAQQWLMEAAKDGYAPAQATVALLYGTGWGSWGKNEKSSAEWMKLASDQGLEEAEFQYAVMLLTGTGVATDKNHATELLEKVAKTGNAHAIMRLGFEKLSQGKRAESAMMLLKSLENADDQILSVLGVLYGWGNAPVFNETAKMTEARRYAQRKDIDAQLMVGLFYAEGWGTLQNSEEAVKWYSTAIKNGNQDARIPLALLYASEGNEKVAAQMMASAVRQKSFAFLHEKDLLKMMFDNIDNVPEVRDMSALEKGKESPEYVSWRQSKITAQKTFIEKNSASGNLISAYLDGLLKIGNWKNSAETEFQSDLIRKPLSKLCILSSQGIEKECQQLNKQ